MLVSGRQNGQEESRRLNLRRLGSLRNFLPDLLLFQICHHVGDASEGHSATVSESLVKKAECLNLSCFKHRACVTWSRKLHQRFQHTARGNGLVAVAGALSYNVAVCSASVHTHTHISQQQSSTPRCGSGPQVPLAERSPIHPLRPRTPSPTPIWAAPSRSIEKRTKGGGGKREGEGAERRAGA